MEPNKTHLSLSYSMSQGSQAWGDETQGFSQYHDEDEDGLSQGKAEANQLEEPAFQLDQGSQCVRWELQLLEMEPGISKISLRGSPNWEVKEYDSPSLLPIKTGFGDRCTIVMGHRGGDLDAIDTATWTGKDLELSQFVLGEVPEKATMLLNGTQQGVFVFSKETDKQKENGDQNKDRDPSPNKKQKNTDDDDLNDVKVETEPIDGNTGVKYLTFSVFGKENFQSNEVVHVSVWAHKPEQQECDDIEHAEARDGRVLIYRKRNICVKASQQTFTIVVGKHSPNLTTLQDNDTITWSGLRSNGTILLQTGDITDVSTLFCALRVQCDETNSLIGNLPLVFRAKEKSIVDKPVADTVVLPNQQPHIFVSYRRMHQDLAMRIKLQLEHQYGYKVFVDVAPSGISFGEDFQARLEQSLDKSKVVLPLITPPPSGPDERRQSLSYLGCIKDSVVRGEIDWCHRELQMALKANKFVLPLYRDVDIGAELRDLPVDIKNLARVHSIRIVNEYFEEALQHTHKAIQEKIRKEQFQQQT